VAEDLLARTGAWALQRLGEIAADTLSIEPTMGERLTRQLGAAAEALRTRPLLDADPEPPDRASIAAVRRAGPPWSTVALLAGQIQDAERDVASYARRLIEPDDSLRWRVFHLVGLGEVLLALLGENFRVTSLRPLSATTVGANYREVLPGRPAVEVLFKAAGVWRATRQGSPYVTATAGLLDAGRRPLVPDILVLSGRHALVIECKYSAAGAYVATGYEQVLGYAAELADHVQAVVAGPDRIVEQLGTTSTGVGRVDMAAASDIREIVTEWL
jgi:hypothetical protein